MCVGMFLVNFDFATDDQPMAVPCQCVDVSPLGISRTCSLPPPTRLLGPPHVTTPTPTAKWQGLELLGAWARLDNRQQLAASLGWGREESMSMPDSAYIIAAFSEWGFDGVSRLEGDFSFAIWDSRRQVIFAARDALGVRPLYYARVAGRFVCASSAALIATIPGMQLSVRTDWVMRYLHAKSVEWDRTAYAEVRKLPPGHLLIAEAGGIVTKPYHRFHDDAPWEDSRNAWWLEAYSRALEEAVRDRIDVSAPIGAETSGGLDSATIVSMIAKLQPDAVSTMHTFGFAMDPLEPEFILETSRAWRIPNNHIMCDVPGSELAARRRGWQAVGYPVEHPSAVSHIPFYSLASRLGVATLHSGHGGDEVVTNAADLVIGELVDRGRWRQLMHDLPGPAALRSVRLAKRIKERRDGVRRYERLQALPFSPLRREYLRELEIERQARWAAMDGKLDGTANGYIIASRLGPHVSTRTSECSLVAATFGIDYRWPLLDRRLIQQYLSTPAIWKFGEGHGRYLHRRAVAGVVPDKVTWKSSKDMSASGRDTSPRVAASTSDVLSSVPHHELHPVLAAILETSRLNTLATQALAARDTRAMLVLGRVNTLNAWLHERDE